MNQIVQEFIQVIRSRAAKVLFALSIVITATAILSFVFLNHYTDGKTFQAKIVVEKKLGENIYRAKLEYLGFTLFKPRKVFAQFYNPRYLWKKNIKINSIVEHNKNQNHFDLIANSNLDSELGVFKYSIRFDITSITLSLLERLLSFFVLYILLFFVYRIAKASLHFANETLSISKEDKWVCLVTTLFCISLLLFTFWLGFPGYHIIGDTYNSIFTIKDNAHPVFIAYVMQLTYLIFGKNLYYLFLVNIIPFYFGLWFLVWGFYLRFKTKWAFALFFPTFIGNIYFQNFVQYTNFGLAMLLFLAYSITLFIILVPLSKKTQKRLLYLLMAVSCFALLWRHNAIFSIYPIFIVLTYKFLDKSKPFLRKYFSLLLLFAIVCLSISLLTPRILATNTSYPANHAFLHQIAGSCVPSNDSSCFKQEWYYLHKSWEDVKNLYAKYPLNADPFNVPWGYDDERPFKYQKLDGLQNQWLKAIIKYPKNFINHELRFFKAMWLQEPSWIFSPQQIQNKNTYHIYYNLTEFPQNQWEITFSPLREQIYTFLFEHKILLNHIWGVIVSFIIMALASFLLLIGKRSETLVYTFSVSFAGFWSAFFIAAFTTVPETRYMSPVLPLAILGCIGFLAYILQTIAIKRQSKILENR